MVQPAAMAIPFFDPRQPLLDTRFPLSLDHPFTRAQAAAAGIRSNDLTRLVRQGLLRRMLPGVYVAAQATDTLELRVEALRLVVRPGAVVTDRTAGWLHGAEMILAPGDHLVTPPLSVFDRKRGGRFRNDLTASGQRMMPVRHLVDFGGLLVTTPLRTACDLGRLLHRDAAFAALDAMLGLEAFTVEELCAEVEWFKGYRGVRQLRALAPEADGRSKSPGESVLRRRWLDCPGLPRPDLLVKVPGPDGVTYELDLAVRELRFGAEYDGEKYHGPEQLEHDTTRRRWITEEELWVLRVLRKANVYGVHADAESILRAGIRAARAALGDPRTFI
jgi:hypothetical protein